MVVGQGPIDCAKSVGIICIPYTYTDAHLHVYTHIHTCMHAYVNTQVQHYIMTHTLCTPFINMHQTHYHVQKTDQLEKS